MADRPVPLSVVFECVTEPRSRQCDINGFSVCSVVFSMTDIDLLRRSPQRRLPSHRDHDDANIPAEEAPLLSHLSSLSEGTDDENVVGKPLAKKHWWLPRAVI